MQILKYGKLQNAQKLERGVDKEERAEVAKPQKPPKKVPPVSATHTTTPHLCIYRCICIHVYAGIHTYTPTYMFAKPRSPLKKSLL